MRLRALALPAAALLLAGCYRVTVVTAAPPSARGVGPASGYLDSPRAS